MLSARKNDVGSRRMMRQFPFPVCLGLADISTFAKHFEVEGFLGLRFRVLDSCAVVLSLSNKLSKPKQYQKRGQ
jgi:hypothetical protein